MSVNKSDKELAFIQDLFIAPDWGERFATLIDEHIEVPLEGRVLYVGSGTGAHALALHDRLPAKVEMVCLDENHESVELAKAKATTLQTRIEFHSGPLVPLALTDESFDLVIAELSLIAPERVPAIVAELARVTKTAGNVALILTTASSFGEFFSIYWEALLNANVPEHDANVEDLITSLPTISEVEQVATREGLENLQSWTQIEEFEYDSGEAFLNSPLVADFLMKGWLRSIPQDWQSRVQHEIAEIINEERHSAAFSLTVKATLVLGQKASVPLVG